MDPTLLRELRQVVGGGHLLVDPEVTAGYSVDWTGRFAGSTPAVVRPATTAEVAEVVRICRRHGAPVVPQGGNTGLVGGGVPLDGEIILSLRRLSGEITADPVAGQLTAPAGATVEEVHRSATGQGWAYGVDLGSRQTATVGGTVATNAGGLRVLRYGDTRAQVVGVEAVLGTAEVVSHLGGLVKDNTGYHLPSLLCGSEGTLGVVTAARLRLVPAAPERVVALVAFSTAGAAVSAAGELRRGLVDLSAAEIFFADGLQLVCRVTGAPDPFPTIPLESRPVYLLVEAQGRPDPFDELSDAVGSLPEVVAVVVATDSVRAALLWRYREAHPEAVNTLGPPHKLDVTLPAAEVAGFIDRVPAAVHEAVATTTTWLWGHVGDGNVHVNVTGASPDDERIDDVVLRLAAGAGGSISAEHGIGTAKRRWLHLNRSEAEILAFRAIKGALDPDRVLNPHVLLPDR